MFFYNQNTVKPDWSVGTYVNHDQYFLNAYSKDVTEHDVIRTIHGANSKFTQFVHAKSTAT